uniref:Granulins domain-containing protein n=1 Tax=Octopus bimaculoides TaxID=37653 RepID=A0A0L8HEK4_OCTBM
MHVFNGIFLWLLLASSLLIYCHSYVFIVTVPKLSPRRKEPPTCTLYLKQCHPDQDTCCPGLQCTNILYSYCLYPFETCYCMTKSYYYTENK